MPQHKETAEPSLNIKECSLNKEDGLRQYSLTPHPNALPQDFLDQQRAESAALLNRGLKSKIIRFVCIDIRLPDGTPYSLTPNKPIIKPPFMDTSMMDMSKRAMWQVSLSPNDPIREKSFPAEGIVLLKLKSDVYGGQYDLEDLVQQRGGSTSGYFLVPMYSDAGSGQEMHPIFNHVQISVDRQPDDDDRGEASFHVTKVSLVYIPIAELEDQQEGFDLQPSSPPIVFPITIASFMDTASAPHKRKLPPSADDAMIEADPSPPQATRQHAALEEAESTRGSNKRRRQADDDNTLDPQGPQDERNST